MNRQEFMKELEYFLQDIPDEEKEDAVSYYRDYLDEAGKEHEAEAIQEFGSPERIAAMIRSELMGTLEDGGAFTESGYRDERFRDPNFQLVKRKHLPDGKEEEWSQSQGGPSYSDPDWNTSQNQEGDAGKNARKQDFADRTWFKRLIKVGLLLVILSVAAPIALGVGGSLLGVVAGALLLLLAAIVLIGVLTGTALLGAVALLVAGFGLLFTNPWSGLAALGAGTLFLGLGLIGLALSVLVYGKFLPWCFRTSVDFVSRLFHGGRRKQA